MNLTEPPYFVDYVLEDEEYRIVVYEGSYENPTILCEYTINSPYFDDSLYSFCILDGKWFICFTTGRDIVLLNLESKVQSTYYISDLLLKKEIISVNLPDLLVTGISVPYSEGESEYCTGLLFVRYQEIEEPDYDTLDKGVILDIDTPQEVHIVTPAFNVDPNIDAKSIVQIIEGFREFPTKIVFNTAMTFNLDDLLGLGEEYSSTQETDD